MSDVFAGPAPHVDGLEEFRAYMQTRELEVRQIYDPPYEFEGEWFPGAWRVWVLRDELLADGRVWFAGSSVSPEYVASGREFGWALLADLVIANRP